MNYTTSNALETISRMISYTSFILVIDNSNIKMKEDRLICDNNVYGSIYCSGEVIRKIFNIDNKCTIVTGSTTSAENVKNYYTLSDIYYASKKMDDGKIYCIFKYVIKGGLMTKLINASFQPYISFILKSERLSTSLNVKFAISPILYNSLPPNHTMEHIIKVFKSLCCANIEKQDKYIALKMLAAFETYIDGQIKHNKYMDIVKNYAAHIYGTNSTIGALHNSLSDININKLANCGISSLCSLYVSQNDEALRQYIYEIMMFLTKNEYICSRIRDDPSILVHHDIRYNISSVWTNIKKLVNLYINISGQGSDVYKMVDLLNNMVKHFNGCSY